MLKPGALLCFHPHRSVQAEAIRLGAQLLDHLRTTWDTLGRDPRARLVPQQGAPLDRDGAEERQESLLDAVPLRLELTLVPQETPPPAQPQNPRADRERELRDLGARDRTRALEARRRPGVGRGVDTVQRERMKVRVEIEGRAKALDLVDGQEIGRRSVTC
jgi:hypothetical protein